MTYHIMTQNMEEADRVKFDGELDAPSDTLFPRRYAVALSAHTSASEPAPVVVASTDTPTTTPRPAGDKKSSGVRELMGAFNIGKGRR